ncbi:MAG TPA: hypothetical protein VIT21_01125 [Chthoniobacterales bacterium]
MRTTKMRLTCSKEWTVGLLLMGVTTASAIAQTVELPGSLTDNNKQIEVGEARLAIQSAVAENETLRQQNVLLTEQIKSITETLAQARVDADSTAVDNKALKLRIEALGLDAVGNDPRKLEQRLVKALGDLQFAQKQSANYREELAGLAEAVLTLLKSAQDVDAEARATVEARLRSVNETMGFNGDNVAKAEPVTPDLTNARVISVKPELGLVVGNVGAENGVKTGMPFRVMSGDQMIALARVVDVRKHICGALIQEQLSDQNPVKVGHRLRVDAE